MCGHEGVWGKGFDFTCFFGGGVGGRLWVIFYILDGDKIDRTNNHIPRKTPRHTQRRNAATHAPFGDRFAVAVRGVDVLNFGGIALCGRGLLLEHDGVVHLVHHHLAGRVEVLLWVGERGCVDGRKRSAG